MWYWKALSSCILLLLVWAACFWSSWSDYFNPKTSLIVFFFNLAIVCATSYIVYTKRVEIKKVAVTSTQSGLACLFVIIATWIVAGVAELTDVQKSLSLLMIPAIVLTTLGPYVVRLLLFPLFCFLLIIPFYDSAFLGRFFLLWVAFGLVFSYLRYSNLLYRLIFVCFAVLLPLAIQWLNVSPLIPSLVGFAVLLAFGVFFTEPKQVYDIGASEEQFGKEFIMGQARWFVPSVVAFFAIVSAPWLSDNIRAFYPGRHKAITLMAPRAITGWVGPTPITVEWNPKFTNPSATLKVQYTDNQFQIVYLYAAYYQADRTVDDLLNNQNTLYNPLRWPTVKTQGYSVPINDSYSLVVTETLLSNAETTRLIWSWYFVMGISSVDVGFIQLLDKVRLISKYADGSGVIAVSTEGFTEVSDGRNRLTTFLKQAYPGFELLEKPEKLY